MARLLRRPAGRLRVDGPAIRTVLVAQHDQLRDYMLSIGAPWEPLDPARPVEFYGWQVPSGLRRGLGLNDRATLHPDGTVEVREVAAR